MSKKLVGGVLVIMEDGKWYDEKDKVYYPNFNKRLTFSYPDFNETVNPYSFFIKDEHGSPIPLLNLKKILESHEDIEVVYLEYPIDSKQSLSVNNFLSDTIDIDKFYDDYVSTTVRVMSSIIDGRLDEFEKAFKETFIYIKGKVDKGKLIVEGIDDWSRTQNGTDRLRRNSIMASKIDITKKSVFLCGGLHFETIFALQDHINPELLDIYIIEDSSSI
tara:strand:- start:827 stop:1480 length:654 start_codon:yes stop_codon:yes gene_type:complete